MKLALGTVQFGSNYGITNTVGQVSIDEVEKILTYAQDVEINCLDTAIAYGHSEAVLGQFNLSNFRVISKIPELGSEAPNIKISHLLEQSLERLKLPKLFGLLLHAEEDLKREHADFIFEQLIDLKKQGLVDKVGVSFYTTDVAEDIILKYPLDLIQIPASQLDNRFVASGILTLAHQKKIEVHARSLFLQGLLVTDSEKRPSVFSSHPDLLNFDRIAKKNNLSQLELALSYLHQHIEINKGVIGCLSLEQLSETVMHYHNTRSFIVDSNHLSSGDHYLINPCLW